MSARAAVLAGLGGYLPPRTVTNEELSRRFDTSDEWIRTRTGVERRHVADPGVSTGDLAVEAGHRALKSAGGGQGAVDMLIVATATPDQPVPATAPDVAARLGLGTAAAFDVQAGCSGFLYGIATASAALTAGHATRVLLIGAEVFSTVLNPGDRTTAVIFGDGAGAVVLRAGTADEPGALLAFDLGADGTGKDLITIPGGGARQRSTGRPPQPDAGYIHMRGQETFAEAVRRMGQSSQAVLDRVGWSADEVDHVVGHQANLRILRTLAVHLGVDQERVVSHIQEAGNTSSASIPLALADAGSRGRFRTGDRLLLTAFGAGLTWGSAALTWPGLTPE
ncbi:beta-ketoacyl-ACP synthase III [Actinacidiphila rubida]|uniref:Beta-ketoacyl-[acyl-carrier-protein] synthase III n=1 Tax=Actinacidiphila rubida TaxID=310780 RepID=A0A1H8E8Y6_9ACTN|nr:beta-ketoacyl-ACP synthase III [Actinacidiphila rubida]SEN15584.1 3-oxoacyl-[acyl-carrier-protein] synthase-3 [Actinacidiphila rubida]